MSLKSQAVRNVAATWLGLLVHGLVGFLLSPFILHRLGDEAFSLWILMFAVTGYFGLLDLGIRSSIVRYTAKFIAMDDREQLSRYLSTSLAFYAVLAIVVLLLTVAGSFYLDLFFKIPGAWLRQARILFLLAGTSVAFTFPMSVFAGVLEGMQKFSWLQLSQVIVASIRAAVTVAVLSRGGGLLSLGLITVSINILSYMIFAGMAIAVLPVSLTLGAVEKAAFRKMVGYGVFAFAILAAEKLRFQSDAMVIGALLSSTAITMFSIAAKLVDYASYAVRSMSQIFTPMSSQFEAAGDITRLQRTFIAGNRACALIIFPLCVTLVVLGKPIIEAWVGPRYAASYYVLVLLIVPRSLYLAQSISTKILLGMGRHRTLASVLLLEGGANLLLSLIMAKRFGILGVALGTAIPLACTSLFFLPAHLCRTLHVPLGEFLTRAYRLPVTLSVPLAGMLLVLNQRLPVHNYRGLTLEIACGGLVYAAGLTWAVWSGGIRSLKPLQVFEQLLEPK